MPRCSIRLGFDYQIVVQDIKNNRNHCRFRRTNAHQFVKDFAMKRPHPQEYQNEVRRDSSAKTLVVERIQSNQPP